MSFVNSFWGPRDRGLEVITARIEHATTTLQELLLFYQQRIDIEKEYNRKLAKLNASASLGSHETGLLKVSLDKLAMELHRMADYNAKFIKLVSQQNYNRLVDFLALYHKKAARLEAHIAKLGARRRDAHALLDAAKTKYKEECARIKLLRFQCQGTWGKELERLEHKLHKLQLGIAASRLHYMQRCTEVQELDDEFVRDWRAIVAEFYQLEAERIHVCKVNCFLYCNQVATLCVELDQAVDNVRTVFAAVLAPADLQLFAQAYGTGDKIYASPKFIEFMDGLEDDDGTGQFVRAEFETPALGVAAAAPAARAQSAGLAATAPVAREQSTGLAAVPTASPKARPLTGAAATPLPPKGHPYTPRVAQPSVPASATTLDPVNLPRWLPTKTTLVPATLPRPDEAAAPALPLDHRRNRHRDDATPSPTRLAPGAAASSGSNYSSGSGEVFSMEAAAPRRTGSTALNPTNYTSSNYSLGSDRNWATPRKRELQEMKRFQERINLSTKELPQPHPPQQQQQPAAGVPIQKDFSIDFIAKALEDLNRGGNGDINQYRRSVRRAKEELERRKLCAGVPYGAAEVVAASGAPAADFVDDRDEVATRYDSIKFTLPPAARPRQSTVRRRPKLMYEPEPAREPAGNPSPARSPQRSLLKTPSKSYTNLHLLLDTPTKARDGGLTPSGRPYVGKARAMYTYKPQHPGELYFKKHWLMYVLHRQEDNWFVCELAQPGAAASVGLVPGNYVTEDYSF